MTFSDNEKGKGQPELVQESLDSDSEENRGSTDPCSLAAKIRLAFRQNWILLEKRAAPEEINRSYVQAFQAFNKLIRLLQSRKEPDLEEQIAVLLSELENHAERFFVGFQFDAENVSAGLALIRSQSRLLLRLTQAAAGEPVWDETPFLLTELHEIETELQSKSSTSLLEGNASGSTVSPTTVTVDFSELREQLIWAHGKQQIQNASRIKEVTPENLVVTYQLFRAVETSIARLMLWSDDRQEKQGSTDRRARDVRLEMLANQSHHLEKRLLSFLGSQERIESVSLFHDLSVQCAGELDELRMEILDEKGGNEVDHLSKLVRFGGRLSDHIRRFTKRIRKKPSTNDDAVKKTTEEQIKGLTLSRRRLRTMIRQSASLISDTILMRRLENTFSAGGVRIWERVVLGMILSALGLIVWEIFNPPQFQDGLPWSIVVDSVICGFLLLDFGVRFTLSPQRWNYFRRKFLTEFLPSLPFGLLGNLENVSMLRSTKILRLVRVFRILRVVRPVFQVFRLVLFLSRAMDRLVDRYSWVLNQNILFFSDNTEELATPTLVKRSRDIDNWIFCSVKERLQLLSRSSLFQFAGYRSEFVKEEINLELNGIDSIRQSSARVTDEVRDLHVDQLIDSLRSLNSNRIADSVGFGFARQVESLTRFLRLPIFRKLPVVRFVLGPEKRDPLNTTARLGKVFGDGLALAQGAVLWFTDLYGSITGAQFLDRVGLQLVQAAARPAKRLILFGVGLAIALLLVQLTHLDFLDDLTFVLIRFLSLPVLIVGGLCIVPLILGKWFRKIAGEATDFYDRVADAQFLALTETAKEENEEYYLKILTERVLIPEVRLYFGDEIPSTEDLMNKLKQIGGKGFMDASITAVIWDPDSKGPVNWSHFDNVILYYRSFLDGAFFHRNDTKLANILVGNLTLENIRLNRLKYSRAQMKRLKRLDLGRGKGGLFGPYVWFNFITHSVSQLTARLIVEYNRYCIPASELDHVPDADRSVYLNWLEKKHKRLKLKPGAELSKGERIQSDSRAEEGLLSYRTTEFTALHFLTDQSQRDHSIRMQFGDEVYRLMRLERENLIRVIFGSFPVHDLPRSRKMINLFRFYNRYLSSAKCFYFPMVAGAFLVKTSYRVARKLIEVVRDVLDPEAGIAVHRSLKPDFNSAKRKIHRMRRPVVMECIILRASFDFEYLGLTLPDWYQLTLPRDQINQDLSALEASEKEWESFRELRSRNQKRMRWLSLLITDQADRERCLKTHVERRFNRDPRKCNEAYRAVINAWLCDHESICSILEAYEALREVFQLAADVPPEKPPFWKSYLYRKTVREYIRKIWPILNPDAEDCSIRQTHEDFGWKILCRGAEYRQYLNILVTALPVETDPYSYCFSRLCLVAEQPSIWSEQMIAVRTVQSLGMLDLEGYERLVFRLGNYDNKQ